MGPPTSASSDTGDTRYGATASIGSEWNVGTIDTATSGSNFQRALAAEFKGFFQTGASGGTVQLQMRQLVNTGAATVIRKGSWMRVTKVTEFV